MPSYIELDKQPSFSASSNVGKVVLGISTNEDVTITNSDGVTTVVGGGLPYLEYVSKISNVGLYSPKTKSVLNNTLSINHVWEKINPTNYQLKLDNSIDVDKAIVNIPKTDSSLIYSEILNNLTVPNNFGGGFDGAVYSIVIQSDGKVLIGGDFTDYNGTTANRLIRLNGDLSIDNEFNIGIGFDSSIRALAVQADDKIIVGGGFNSFNGNSQNYIIRLNADGSIDNTFSIGNGFNGDVYSIAFQYNGQIIVGGNFTDYNATIANHIIRLNADGSIDNTFSIGSGFNSRVFSIAIQYNGQIIVGGQFGNYDGTTSNYIIRLNADGSIDNTFSIGSGFDSRVFSIAIQSDGKIVVGGQFNEYNGTTSNYIIRLNTDGSINYNATGGFDGDVNSIVIQSDGKILVGGGFNNYNSNNFTKIIALNSDFSIDSNFKLIGSGFNNSIYSIAIQSDDKIIVGGDFSEYNGNTSNNIELLNSDGYFGFKVGFNKDVNVLLAQSGGTVYIGGNFGDYNKTSSNHIIKLTNDGTIDTTFNVGNGFNDDVYSIAVQSDGKVLVGGEFSDYDGTTVYRMVRLNTDGSLDNTFSIGSGFDSRVFSIAIQSDGKVLVGGSFGSFNGESQNGIIRLNTDGSIDNTFSIGSGFDGDVYSIIIQSDEKILVGGAFTNYNGTTANYIIRLNTDGSIDKTPFLGFNDSVLSIAVQSDGKILVGGDFSNYDSCSYNRLIRLNSDLSIDNTFSIGSGFDGDVNSIVIQSDGKVLIGGDFTNYNGTTANYIIKLNTDGSINDAVINNATFDGKIITMNILSDGNILVGGHFNAGDFSDNIIKINNDIICSLYKDDDILDNQPIEIRVYN